VVFDRFHCVIVIVIVWCIIIFFLLLFYFLLSILFNQNSSLLVLAAPNNFHQQWLYCTHRGFRCVILFWNESTCFGHILFLYFYSPPKRRHIYVNNLPSFVQLVLVVVLSLLLLSLFVVLPPYRCCCCCCCNFWYNCCVHCTPRCNRATWPTHFCLSKQSVGFYCYWLC